MRRSGWDPGSLPALGPTKAGKVRVWDGTWGRGAQGVAPHAFCWASRGQTRLWGKGMEEGPKRGDEGNKRPFLRAEVGAVR